MIPLQSNHHPELRSIEGLAAGWRELARRMRLLEQRGAPLDPEATEQMRALIARSAESIRGMAGGLPEPLLDLQQPETTRGAAMRMLANGPPSAVRAPVFDSLDLPPGRAHKLLLRGTGSALPAQDIVRQLAASKQTGILKLRTEREIFTIELEAGQIAHLQTDTAAEGEHLGEILVRRNFIGAAQMDALRKQHGRGRFGEILLSGRHLTPEQLQSALETQIHLLIGRLCQVQAENFSFWQGPLVLSAQRLRIDVSQLLLEPFLDEGGPPLVQPSAG